MLKEKSTKTLMLISVMITLLIISIGISFAYFTAVLTGNEETVSIRVNSGNLYIAYEGGSKVTVNALTPSDEPFGIKTFTVTGSNNASSELRYYILFDILENTYSEDAIMYQLSSENTGESGQVAPSINDLTGVNTGAKVIFLGAGLFSDVTETVHTYELILYFPETGVDQNIDQEKTLRARVSISEGIYMCEGCLNNKIIANHGGIESLQAVNQSLFLKSSPTYEYKEIISSYPDSITSNNNKAVGSGYEFNKETGYYELINCAINESFTTDRIGSYTFNLSYCGVITDVMYEINEVSGTTATNLTKYESEISHYDYSDTGLFLTLDDYGTSYYFRGDKERLNNNLIFAEHQWKIVRINGDGSIRIIYNGECPNNACVINNNGNETSMGTSPFNLLNNDNKYIGYMYGLKSEPTTTYNEAHINEVNSTVKNFLDDWYINNILNEGYDAYISDSIFCGDRKLDDGLGFGNNETNYMGRHRLQINNIPSLRCEQKIDRYTVDDEIKGNSNLTYPVGLITTDEAVFGGLSLGSISDKNYLNSGIYYWSLNPSYFDEYAYNWSINPYDSSFYDITVNSSASIRGVLNLKSSTTVIGNGSIDNPYIVN